MVYTISRCLEIVPEDKGSIRMEVFVAFVASIPFFTYGIESTSLTSSAHAGDVITSAGVPWSTTALVVASILAAPVFCWCVDRLGRRSGVFIVTLVQAASLIPLFLLNSTSTLVLHILAGIAAGGLFTVLPVYLAELTSLNTRGFCMLLMMVMTTLGYMTRLVMDLEERMYLMTALVMLQMILMVCVCESPSYLMMKGKVERSKKTLSRLKRLPEDSPSLQKQIGTMRDESERATSRGTITLISFYRTKIWWDALKVGLCLYTATALCGSIVFLDQQKTLTQLKVDTDPQNKLVLAAMVAGSLCSLVCATFLDRKILLVEEPVTKDINQELWTIGNRWTMLFILVLSYLLTVGYLNMALSSGVLAVYTQADLTVATLRWVPVVALAALVLGYGMSWALHVVIVAELYGTELRATILGILFSYSQLIKLAHVHTFQYLEDYVGIYTMFYIFACINLYGAVYTLFAVPTIRKKSLKQIEKQLKRTPLPA